MSRLFFVLFILFVSTPAVTADFSSSPVPDSFMQGKQAYDRQDWKGAIATLRPLAEKGDDKAMILLGNMYLEGYGVAADEKEAFALYRQSALNNNTDGIVALATLYRNGMGVPKNDRLAILWFERGARMGNGTAAFFHAINLYEGSKGDTFDFKPDHPQAYKWFRIASGYAKGSLAEAANQLSFGVAQKITPEEKNKAEAEAQAFVPETPDQLGPTPEAPHENKTE